MLEDTIIHIGITNGGTHASRSYARDEAGWRCTATASNAKGELIEKHAIRIDTSTPGAILDAVQSLIEALSLLVHEHEEMPEVVPVPVTQSTDKHSTN